MNYNYNCNSKYYHLSHILMVTLTTRDKPKIQYEKEALNYCKSLFIYCKLKISKLS